MVRILLPSLICALALVACGPNAAPEAPAAASEFSWPGKDWQTSTPEREGLDGRSIATLDEEIRAGTHGYIDSMLIVRNGRLAFEAYYEHDYETINSDLVTGESGPWNYYDVNWHPYHMGSDLHTVQSTTKSFMSALVGIAIAHGDLPGVDATLGELLPERNITDPAKAAITLDNVLTMRPGFEWEEDVSYWDPRNDAIRVEATDDWVAYLLAKPLVHEQGTYFKYNSTNTQLMSEMVSNATGRALNDYAEEWLFGPIGITDYSWKDAPEGFKDVAGGLYLKPRDLARFGLLFVRDGEWDGRQVVPAAWVRRSGTPHVADTAPGSPDFNVGYGYQWWVYNDGSDGRPYMYGTWGWGGQFALVVPALDLVGVFTGWNVYERQDHEYAFRLFYERVVLPAAAGHKSSAQQVLPLWGADEAPFARPHSVEEYRNDDCWGGVPCIHQVVTPTLTLYLPETEPNGTAVVILPGGGYEVEAVYHEGYEIAAALAAQGSVAAVLKYRLPNPETSTAPWRVPEVDVRQALTLLRERQRELGFNARKFGVLGFSAGGHLAASVSVHRSEEPGENPDFSILVYGVTIMNAANREWLEQTLYHRRMTGDEVAYQTLLGHVNAGTPPAFLVHAYDDDVVPYDESTRYAGALQLNGVAAEIHLYARGGHGFGPGREEDGTNQWVNLAANWLERLGKVR